MVDVSELRFVAKLDHRKEVLFAADEIESLRKQLADAKWARDQYGRDLKEANGFLRDHVDGVRPFVERTEKLNAELVEARANAIPWRDGPAKGGEMPDNSWYTLVGDFKIGEIVMRLTGYVPDDATDFIQVHGMGRTDVSTLIRYFYVDDIPSAPEKAKVKS